MKFSTWIRPLLLSLIVLCTSTSIFSQRSVSFKTGTFPTLPYTQDLRYSHTTQYIFYQADHVLTTVEKEELNQQGIEILYALHNHIYWVRVRKPLKDELARNFFDLNPAYKVAVDPMDRSHSERFRLSLAPGLQLEEINAWASLNQIILLDTRVFAYGLIDVQASAESFDKIKNTPWISYIGPLPHDEEINYRADHGERGRGLTSPLTRGLDGRGITVGIGDGGRLGVHDDLSRSIIDLTSFGFSSHATHVSGIVSGAGLIDPFYGHGHAPKANIILRNFSDILWDAPQYIHDFGLSLTNNSYGTSLNDCNYFGDYDGTSAGLDAMVFTHPQLLHVFAAANSGGMTCTPYPAQFATLAGGYQPAKNVLTVGAVTNEDANAGFSSRGPSDDGRIKPEIVAYGVSRFSTNNNHTYGSGSGTSFSSPGVTGIATLLYERYRELHNDSLPDAALIKNVLCNGADDLGNVGPDYIYGFGRINGVRSVEMLEAGHYTSVNVDQDNTLTKVISVPAGTAFVDVMLLWTDVASAPFETVTLVNDLDIVVIKPNGDTLKPWKLNYTPSGVNLSAGTGIDRINNYEQVTIQTPGSGDYTIVIKGHQVPMGPQKAWLSWDVCLQGITVQGPIGGEVYKPGNVNLGDDRQYIRWDAFGTGSSTFTAQYSTNGGSTWNTIASAIPANRRYQEWFPPNTPTDQLKVKVTATNGMLDTSDQHAVIMAAPGSLTASSPCKGYVQVGWNAVAGASYYRIFTIRNETLTAIDTTSGTSIVVGDFPYDSAIRVTVSGVFASGVNGLRARAVMITANGGNNCAWDHDLRLDSIVALTSGRIQTSSTLTATEPITVRITNAGTMSASGFSLSYSLNDVFVSSDVFPGILNSGAGQNFTFSTTADLAATGAYKLKVWTTYLSDTLHQNDTLIIQLHHLPNPVVSLPWTESFENTPDTTIISSQVGLPALNTWDAYLQPNARIRTFAGDTFSYAGHHALTVDAIRSGTNKSADLLLTLNMSSWLVAQNDIRLNLYVMHHEFAPDVNNNEAIWIRGSDTSDFVLLTYISNDATLRGQWQYMTGLDLTAALAAAGQEYSSSFQLKFSHGVFASAGQLTSEDGQTIDGLSIHVVQRDITISDILHPGILTCDTGIDTVSISITNTSSQEVTSARAYYRLDEGTTYSTFIGTVPAQSTINVSLLPSLDIPTSGIHDLEVWVYSADDDFHFNDTVRMQILQTPFVNSFPYTEGFENSDGGYVTDGIRSSWTHGVPGKQLMSKAAEGKRVWTTSLNGTHNADEISYLYSPCFDLHGLAQPYLSFGFMFELEVGYDYAWVEYRVEGSNVWVKLGVQGGGVNWYNNVGNRWNGTQSKWVTTGHAIPVADTVVQFRWVMQSDVGVEEEGLAIDQVHIYDRKPLYTGGNMQWTLPVSGSNWMHIEQGGQRIFSIHPQGQDLGDVTLAIYKSGSNFHLTDSLYLLSRNWVLTSTIPPANPITLRGYFTKEEATNLVNASGCSQCVNARDGFDFAALRYSGDEEDGNYSNNDPTQVITYSLDSTDVLPFDNGYYAEWETQGLSEWWITSVVTNWAGMLERSISSSYDDAEEHQDNGAVNPIRESLSLTARDGFQKVGWRFQNVSIPRNSYISSAHIQWTSADTSSSTASWIMQSELVADAQFFSLAKYNLSFRPRSSQVVQWSPTPWSATETTYLSPDIRHVIQQVIDQSNWNNGNDLVLLLRGTGLREAWSYDGAPLKGAKLLITFDSICTSSGICYVNKLAAGMQTGTTWTDAYRSVEQALDHAAHCPDITEIWITGGTYAPYSEVSRTTGFSIPSGVSIYGGFEGDETDISQRVYGAYPTILTGDIGVTNISSDNLYHVLTMLPGADGALLDGITIRDGFANGAMLDLQRGSALFNLGKITMQQVIIEDCSAPPVYNSPGSTLTTNYLLEIRQ